MAKSSYSKIATTSPSRAPLFRRALYVVMPAHIIGAASVTESFIRDRCQCFRWCNHIVSISAIVGNTRYLCIGTSNKVSPSTRFAATTMATMPANTYPLSSLPSNDILSHSVYKACDFVSGDPWIFDAWK